MRIKTIFSLAILGLLTACSNPYDYSGTYLETKGDNCEVKPGDNRMFTISPSTDDQHAYTAKLAPRMLEGGIFPAVSKVSKASKDGSIAFIFIREGIPGNPSGMPSVEMKVTLRVKNQGHVYIESWPIIVTNPNNPSVTKQIEFVKDLQKTVGDAKTTDGKARLIGENGICLKKEAI